MATAKKPAAKPAAKKPEPAKGKGKLPPALQKAIDSKKAKKK